VNYLGTMEMVSGMRRQIIGLLRSLGLVRTRGAGNMKDLNQNSRNWSVIKAVVGSGLYPNFIKVFFINVFNQVDSWCKYSYKYLNEIFI